MQKIVLLPGFIIALAIASCKADISPSEDKSGKAVTTEDSTPGTKYESKLADTIHAANIKAHRKIGRTPRSKGKLSELPENAEVLPWDDKLALAIQIAEKYNCMPNTIEQQANLSPEEKAAIEELWFMTRVLANIYADDALRLVNHNCPTVRMYALMALRSWGREHYSKAMIENIPNLNQMNVCHHDKIRSIGGIDPSREWMKGVIKALHEIPNSPSPTLLKDPALLQQIVSKAEGFIQNYAAFPDSYISLNETTPAYPRCRIFNLSEGTHQYYLELVGFLNDKSGTQRKLIFFFHFDEQLEISNALPFSTDFIRNLPREEQELIFPEKMDNEMPE